MDYTVTVLMTEFVTHDVKRFIVEKPDGLEYEPGQGVELAIDHPDWKDEGRPFTPTSLRDDRVLEFTIKSYPEHEGMTQRLHQMRAGDRLLMSDAFGTITYRGAGVFIAGGAGITPFIAIIRQLADTGRLAGHSLIFSNKTPADIICEKELRHHLGERCFFTCTDQAAPGYDSRRIDAGYLGEKIEDLSQQFYVCGPPKFVEDVNGLLEDRGASPDALIFER